MLGGHAEQLVDAGRSEYVFPRHGKHSVDSLVEEYLPAGQSKQGTPDEL